MSSAVEAAVSCSKVVVDIKAEEASKDDRAVAAEHGNGDAVGKKSPHCRKGDVEDDEDEDGEKVPEHIDLGPILSIKDQLEKDKVRHVSIAPQLHSSSCCTRIAFFLLQPTDR